MQNKEICYGWFVFYKKFLINSWKFVLKNYSLLYYIPVISCFAGEQSRGEQNSHYHELSINSLRLIIKSKNFIAFICFMILG